MKIVFKFTLLGIEFSRNKRLEGEMPRKRKAVNQRKKFAKYSRICHKEPTQDKYYKCMSKNLKKWKQKVWLNLKRILVKI